MYRLLLILLVLFAQQLSAQMELAWGINANLSFGGPNQMMEDSEGNLYYIKYDTYGGIGNWPSFIQKYTSEGELIWQFGESDFTDNTNNMYLDFALDSDLNVYVVGSNFPTTASYPKTEIIKISPDGVEVWRENFTTTSTWSEVIQQIEITDDNRIFLISRLYNPNIDTLSPSFIEMDTEGNTVSILLDTDFEIGFSEMKVAENGRIYAYDDDKFRELSETGEVLWEVDLHFESEMYYFDALALNNAVLFQGNHIAMVMAEMNDGSYTGLMGLRKLSYDGSVMNETTIQPLADISNMQSLRPIYLYASDAGDLYVTGMYSYGDGGGANLGVHGETMDPSRGGKGGSSFQGYFVSKLNANLQLQWTSTFESLGSVDQMNVPAGGFFHGDHFVYHTSLGNYPDQLLWFAAFNSETGAIDWTYTELPSNVFSQFRPESIFVSSDGGVFSYGIGEAYNEGNMQYQSDFIYKYNLTPFNSIDESSTSWIFVYPNPAASFVVLNNAPMGEWIMLYDISGQLIERRRVTANTMTLDVSTLANGLYTLQAGQHSAKFVVER